MKQNFLRRLRAAWYFTRKFPYTQLPPGFWTRENALAWSHFKVSDTGQKIDYILRNKIYELQLLAVMEKEDSRYACGTAFGARGLVAELDALLMDQIGGIGTEEEKEETYG
jgi:hypothetical protein